MPECDGEQLCRLIRTYDHLTRTRLILMAGSVGRAESAALKLGFAAVLEKPTTEQNLAACLAKVMYAKSATTHEADTQDGLIELATARVITLSAYRTILRILKQDPALIRQLGPEALEAFVRERMEMMGFTCAPISPTRQPDGGIDLIACPIKAVPFPFLLAVQVKSHRAGRQSASREVRDFLGAITGKPITAGVLVTNTTFSADAQWVAAQHQQLLRLRDVHDLRRWVQDDFTTQELWREIPSTLEVRPGLTVDVHRKLRIAPQVV
jgi:CheY-like chemotaxis protein